jgi:hypothetical protein
MGGIQIYSNHIFSGSSLPLLILNTFFRISVTRSTHNRRKTKIRQDPLINTFLLQMVQCTHSCFMAVTKFSTTVQVLTFLSWLSYPGTSTYSRYYVD